MNTDSLWDEIVLQTLACERCEFVGLAVYQESGRGGFDNEIVEHRGYRIDRPGYDAITGLISVCPNLDDTACDCPAHITLGATDPTTGLWDGLVGYSVAGNFPMRLVSRLWSPTDRTDGYEALINGKRWFLRRNADPLRPIYTLSIDGHDVADLDSWPTLPQ